ncbi:MAG: hypothetical protein IPO77_09595 [Acidobacteria bacterium]|nr:hypothetical protein [Acidobacteriota bacterium]
MSNLKKPIAIYHEHQEWFRPLFAELERRGTKYVRIDARSHRFDPSETSSDYSLVLNRMSPSAYLRGNGHGIFHTHAFLWHLDLIGTPVINGRAAFTIETSKALQLSLLQSLDLPYPRALVINHPNEALAAAEQIRFPIVVKANIGGSGAGIVRYDTPEALRRAFEENLIDLGIDQTALVQEYIPARGGYITRVETLGGKYLYAIKVFITGETFNLCPADICQTTDGVELNRAACPADAPKNGLRVEAYTPPAEVIEAVERIAKAANLDVGGIEYIIDDRDGKLLFYDINALSNFVAEPQRVIGFDPHVQMVDYLESRAYQMLSRTVVR